MLIHVSAVAPLIGRYCGTKIPPEIQSSSGLLSLSFHTDMAVAKDGFSARYNMTHKEVSDCECQITSSKFVCVCVCERSLQICLPVCVHTFTLSLSSPSALPTLIFLSSSLALLTPSISPAVPTVMLFQSRRSLSPLSACFALSSESVISQK